MDYYNLLCPKTLFDPNPTDRDNKERFWRQTPAQPLRLSLKLSFFTKHIAWAGSSDPEASLSYTAIVLSSPLTPNSHCKNVFFSQH